MKKIISILLLVCMCVTLLASCGGNQNPGPNGDDPVELDATKTQLYVRYYAGGLGTEWIEEICQNFERDFANVSFEEGKKGVQIVRKFEKTQVAADQISGNNSDIFFMEHMSYTDAVNKNYILDVTDIVNDYAVTGYSGEGTFNKDNLIKETASTIKDKISASNQAYYEIDGKYYGTPFYTGVHQIIYNKELFDANNLYFNAASDTSLDMFDDISGSDAQALAAMDDWFVASSTAAKSKGPDGTPNTYDDGLPATYGELWVLMERMVRLGITPFIFQEGYADHYFSVWDKDIWASAEGAEQMLLNLSWNGTATNLLDANGKTYSAEITADNAYLLQTQAGRLSSLNFYEMLLSNPAYVYDRSWDSSFTHLNAQTFFVKAGQEGNYVSMKFGMLMDGSWWNSESKEQFANNTFLTRDFGVMPIPKTDSSKVGSTNADGTHVTQIDAYGANVFIKSNIAEERKEVAKLFLSYATNDKSLNTFTKYTQAFRAMSYTLTEDTLASMTPYGKAAYEVYKDSNVIAWLPTSDVVKNNLATFAYRSYAITNGKSDGSSAMAALRTNKFADAQAYFDGTFNYYKNNWSKLINP